MTEAAVQGTDKPTVLVTGAAGFIGSAVAVRLAGMGYRVVGCDNFNDYYDPALKRHRVEALLDPAGVPCETVELSDGEQTAALFERVKPALVVHLAAQAGVRYSLKNPAAYVQANLVAFGHILEGCRKVSTQHLVRQQQQRLRRQRQDPVQRNRPDRRAGLAVRGDQEGQ